MPRKNQNARQSSPNEHARRKYERWLRWLAEDLHTRWRDYQRAIIAAGEDVEYDDPNLLPMSLNVPEKPSLNKETRQQLGRDREEARRNRRRGVLPEEPQGPRDTGSSPGSNAK